METGRQQRSPKAFLKARRPERFSDSTSEDIQDCDKSLFEYHLESLTSRSQETEFERFARALARVEICPNIAPQTGPTGGGDSKVDAETYPVAADLAYYWYVGTSRESAAERWAFAFSAKKQWQGKVRSDVQKIAATQRGYTRAFFVTNQFVADKKRAQLEDELTSKYGLNVRILDRSWITDVVFSNQRQNLAIELLGVSPTIKKHIRKGPCDLVRESELVELESRLESLVSSEDKGFVLVDTAMEAAIVARGLELPKVQVTGRFERASNLAERFGSKHQQVVSSYDRAWTEFFWFEDLSEFAHFYRAVETSITGSSNVFHLELLLNLWMLLQSHCHGLPAIDEHTKFLRGHLER